ncbi:MAG: UDP-2,3-diacylglucosamine diphosphatase [Pseudomonadota bacterium]
MSERPVYFVSDIHLNDGDQPQNALFLAFLNGPARSAGALYILGDLFEYWLGDDVPSAIGDQVAASCRALKAQGTSVYFMAGNRDFLLGKRYAARAGFTLLPDSIVETFWGTPILLHHGDCYCVQDTQYLKYRAWAHQAWLQTLFLALPRFCRSYLAKRLRQSSKAHTTAANPQTFHIPPTVVINAAKQAKVSTVLHGHIHRPIDTQHIAGDNIIRHVVLGEWSTEGSVGVYTPNGLALMSLDKVGQLNIA